MKTTTEPSESAQLKSSRIEKLIEQREKIDAEIEAICDGAVLILEKVVDPYSEAYQISTYRKGEKKLAAYFVGLSEEEVNAAYNAISGVRRAVNLPLSLLDHLP